MWDLCTIGKACEGSHLLTITVAEGWEICQIYVHNAFLHGDLDEEAYMSLPPGFHSIGQHKVCRIHKSLYGLQQISRKWFSKLTSAIQKILILSN